MFKSSDFLNRSSFISELYGIYIAQPLGSRMRVIDKSRSDKMPDVNDKNIKFGRAKNLKRRFRDYYFDNDGDVQFTPIIIFKDYIKEELENLENHIKSSVKPYRMQNPKTNRPLEWLEGLTFNELKGIIHKCHGELNSIGELI